MKSLLICIAVMQGSLLLPNCSKTHGIVFDQDPNFLEAAQEREDNREGSSKWQSKVQEDQEMSFPKIKISSKLSWELKAGSECELNDYELKLLNTSKGF